MARNMKNTDLKALLKRVVELVMPDLRSYYQITRKAKIVRTYASDGQYWADVQPLRNDESVDPNEPVISRVEIPVVWAGPKRGIVCPPLEGSYCDLSYYDGDPDYPRISNFRWHGNVAPECEIGGLIIQREPGTHIKIDSNNNIIHITPSNRQSEIGGDKSEIIAGNKTASVGGDISDDVTGNWTIVVDGTATIQSPQINLAGAGGGVGMSSEKSNKTHEGSYTLIGDLAVTGNISATGTIIDAAGNTNHHSHV